MNVDAAYFLRLRTRFIGRYYFTGVGPFREIQRKIDAEESPYDEPPPSFDPEYGEPAFLEEWIEADDAAQVVGRSAVSLLSDALKLYCKALEQQLGFRLSAEGKAIAKKEGFLSAYKGALGELLQLTGPTARCVSTSSSRSCWRAIARSLASTCQRSVPGMIPRR